MKPIVKAGVMGLLALLCLGAVGPQRAQVVMANFPNYTSQPCTREHMAEVIFTRYNGWIQTESHGKESFPGSIDNVWGWWVLPHNIEYYCTMFGNPPQPSTCNNELVSADLDALIVQHGAFDPAAQDLIVAIMPDYPTRAGARHYWSSCWPGAGDPPDIYDLNAAIHEGGHAQGLGHANMLYCASGEDIGLLYDYNGQYQNGCTVWQYGNMVDPMGATPNYDPARWAIQHYSMAYQDFLGWKQPGNRLTVMASTQVTLTRMDVDTNAVQEVWIPLPSVSYFGYPGNYGYSIEYRPETGVLINLVTDLPVQGIYSVATVNGKTWPPAITAANPFVDGYRNIGVKLVASNGTIATVAITIGSTPQPPKSGKGHGGRKVINEAN